MTIKGPNQKLRDTFYQTIQFLSEQEELYASSEDLCHREAKGILSKDELNDRDYEDLNTLYAKEVEFVRKKNMIRYLTQLAHCDNPFLK